MMIYGREIASRLIFYVIGVVILIVVVFGTLNYCGKQRSKGAQARVERSQAEAQRNSAGDAINTVTGVGENAAASEELTRSNEREIRNAPGANDPVNPAARDAGLRSLCRRPAYRDNPRCRVFQPSPR